MQKMRNELAIISGGGGSSPPTPHKPVEFDDTISSKQRVRMLFAICEGEIDSISEVYINGTPISGYDASYEVRTGTVDQTHIAGFSQVEAPFVPSINSQMLYGVPVIREVTSNSVDAIRATIRLAGLSKITDIGDRVGHSVTFSISTRKDDLDVWTVIKTITISEKITGSYKMDVRIERPDNAIGATWQVAVQRVSPDDANSKSTSKTYFDNFTEIQDVQLSYPHTTLLAVVINNADEVGNDIPTISCDGKFRKVKVPAAAYYDAANRTYTGTIWGGAWALSNYATSCLSWIVYDVLINGRFALPISESDINKFSFFDFAQECDWRVDDGKGLGTLEPRFSIDNQFFKRENAPTFLTKLLTLGNAKLINDEFGLISIISDAPAAATKIINNNNVIDGLFDYPSSELSETYTWVNVTYNDPNDKFRSTTIFEKDQVKIDRFGLIKMDVVLEGCKSEGQARRKARWVLSTPEGAVAFKVGLEGMIYSVGMTFKIMDDYKKNVLQQGRIKSSSSDASSTTIILDRALVFGNESYSVLCYSEDTDTLYDAAIIESNVTTDTITVNLPGPLATNPPANSPFIIEGDIIAGEFKVSSIDRDNDEFTVYATNVDQNKYDYIENGYSNRVPTAPFINTGGFVVEPVENVDFTEIFAASGVANLSRINVTWDWDIDESSELTASYQYTWRRDSLPFSALQTSNLKEFEIDSAVPGIYEVVITAFNPRGINSTPVSALYSFRTTEAQSTLKPPTDFYVINTVGTTFQNRDLSVSWFYDTDNDDRTLVNDSLLDYVIEIWAAGVLKNSYTEKPNSSKNGTFTYTFQDNENDHSTASRSVEMRIYCRDTVGDVSLATVNTFSNPVPPVVSFTLLAGTGSSFVNITPPSDPDTVGYLVYRDTSSISFTPSAANLKYDGPDNYIALGGDAGVEYFYKVAAYDSFGKASPNMSGGQSSTTLAAETDKFAFTGLQFTPNSPATNSVAWAAGSVSINGASTVVISSGNATWTAGTLYLYFDKATVSIGSTTDITIAVTKAQIIAVYEGGLSLSGGDGTAFFNGAQLIAQSVGAGQLVVDTAIITQAAQIASLIVNNSHMQNLTVTSEILATVISSIGFSDITKLGWKLDRSSGLTIYDGSIDLVGVGAFSIKSATTGARTIRTAENTEIYDSAGVLRVKMGKLI